MPLKGISYSGAKAPPPLDIRRFDLRVAIVRHILQHPTEGRFFIQNIIYYQGDEEGDMDFKLAVNQVAQHYSEEEMDDKLVVVLCNPRPTVVEGFIVRALMMCATTDNKLELLVPPPGSVQGDEITVEGYPREPDEPFMMPMERPLETISADLRVNAEGQAVYRGVPLQVEGKGYITTSKLSCCPIVFQ